MERTNSVEPSLVLRGTGVGERNANNSPLMQFLFVFMPDLNRYFANRLYFVSAALRTFTWSQVLKMLHCPCHTEICLFNIQEKCPTMGFPVPGDLTELSQDLRDYRGLTCHEKWGNFERCLHQGG